MVYDIPGMYGAISPAGMLLVYFARNIPVSREIHFTITYTHICFLANANQMIILWCRNRLRMGLLRRGASY